MIVSSPAKMEIESLLEEARRGDHDSLWRALRACWDEIYRFAKSLVVARLAPKVSPSDIVARAFQFAGETFSCWKGRTRREFLAWLRGIARMVAASMDRFWHRAKRDVEREEVWGDGSIREELLASAPSPEEAALQAEQSLLVQNVLNMLQSDQRQIIYWRIWEGLDYAEIGQQFHCTATAARMRYSRAIRTFAEMLIREKQYAAANDWVW